MTKLDEYFDRARRETPPLQKDEVSNILREKLSERPDRETAHTRGNGVWSRSIGRIFLTLPPKGWIMISALLTSTILATAFFWQATPQSSYNGASAPQTLPAAPQAAAPTGVSQKKLALKPQTEPKYAVKTQVSKPEALTTINTQALKDSLPAPYDFVPVDDAPQVDMKELTKHIVYPQEAEKLGLEGKVTVRALLMPDKSISPRSFVEYSDGMKFDSAALKAVFAAEWIPAKRNGKAVPCWVSVPVHFRLPERLGKKVVTNAQMLALTSDELKKMGYNYEFNHNDIQSYKADLHAVYNTAKTLLIQISNREKDLERLQKQDSQNNKKEKPIDQFDMMLISLSEHYKYEVQPHHLTVARFAKMMNRVKEYAKKLEDNINAQGKEAKKWPRN